MEKIALITGASRGIGKAFAEEFARNGFSLILIARTLAELQGLQQQLKSQYQTDSKILSIDLQQPDSIDRIMNEIQNDLPNLQVLVNNAGFGISKKLTETPEADVDGMLTININLLTKLTYRVLPHMQNKKRGMILNLASTAAYVPGPYMAIYYASKAYVLSFSEAIHEELKQDGIFVTALCPGYTKSTFHDRAGKSRLMSGWLPKMSAEQVAKIGYDALMKNKRVVTSGFLNKLSLLMMYLTPNFILLKIIAFLDTKAP